MQSLFSYFNEKSKLQNLTGLNTELINQVNFLVVWKKRRTPSLLIHYPWIFAIASENIAMSLEWILATFCTK